MRANKYIYIVEYNSYSTIIFNGLNRIFIIIESRKLDSIIRILKNPDLFKDSNPKSFEILKRNKFIVNDSFSENDFLKNAKDSFINEPFLKTVILPTYDCNFSCWYCVQSHKKTNFTKSTQDVIIKHIKKYLLENGIKKYAMSWFGGEPLIQADNVAKMTSEIKHFCEENNILFSSGITTNGSLLNKKNIELISNAGISFYQITIDGVKSNHDKIKFDNIHESAFELVLGNIRNALSKNQQSTLQLRINYTPELLSTPEIVDQISERIPKDLRNRISIDLQRVWQIKDRDIDYQKLFDIEEKFSKNGFYLDSSSFFEYCYVDKKHHNMIYYDGSVDKCDNRTAENARGYIDNDGNLIWKSEPLFYKYDVLSPESSCSHCNFYPLCLNCCTVDRENGIMENGRVVCRNYKNSELFESRIRDYCHRVTLNKSLLKGKGTNK